MSDNSLMACPICGKPIASCSSCGASFSSDDVMDNFKKFHGDEYKLIEERISQKFTEKAQEDTLHYHQELDGLKSAIDKEKMQQTRLIKQELQLRQALQEAESKERLWELEQQRILDDQRKKLTEKLDFDHALQKKDLLEQMEGMKRTIAELSRKSAQGSMQTQGESLELLIGDRLQEYEDFKLDLIEHVPKGVSGADIHHKVRSPGGVIVGSILWENKRTKDFSVGWLEKLKQDQRNIGANFAILVTQTMPKGITHCKFIDGVWVSDFQNYIYLAAALRMNLLDVYQARSAAEATEGTMTLLYNYITDKTFIRRVEALAEYFRIALEDLEKERRALNKLWTSREQHIRKAETSVIGLYGDCKGILSDSLPSIDCLELSGM